MGVLGFSCMEAELRVLPDVLMLEGVFGVTKPQIE